MEDKICTICKKGLTLDKFGKCKNAKDGLKPQCKECRNEENKQHYIKNKAKVIERTKKYSIDNKDKMRIWRIQYLKDNSAKVIERDTKYRRNHRKICLKVTEAQSVRTITSCNINVGAVGNYKR